MTLDDLLAAAQDADPRDRIELRDRIAAHGEQAIEAMTDWLGDPRLAAFAIRVLERIGRAADQREAVVATLRAVDREELAAHLGRDVDAALAALSAGASAGSGGRTRGHPNSGGRAGERQGSVRPIGRLGVEGRRYWAMRTSPGRHDFIWSEAQQGRLRQGWGWTDRQDLEVIAATLRRGGEIDDDQQVAWRSRRMLSTEPDGVRPGDLVVAPNLPAWGELCVFRLAGTYAWSPADVPAGWEDRFGHLLPVELVAWAVDRRAPVVSEALRSALRPQSRLFRLDGVAGDVEAVVEELGKA